MRVSITLDRRPRTIAMPDTLAELLSITLVGRVDSGAVRDWCQARVNEDVGAFRFGAAARRLQQLALLAIVPADVREAYWDRRLPT
jgi:hypothetical protein